MKLSTILATTCALSIYVSSELARAEGRDSYAGIQFASADTSIDGVPDDVDLDVATLQLGVWLSDNASLEFRVGKGFGDDSVGLVDLEVEGLVGLYGTYHWNMGDNVSVYGIAGWSEASVKASVDTTIGGQRVYLSEQTDEDGLSYGAGIKISIFSVEYMRYLDTSDVEADAVSVGLYYGFE